MELNRVISAIYAVDDALKCSSHARLHYFQSRFWLFRYIQQAADHQVKHRNESFQFAPADIFCFLLAILRLLALRLGGRRAVLVIEHMRQRGLGWEHGDPYLGITEKELVDRGKAVVVIGLTPNEITKWGWGRKSRIVIPRSIINGIRFIAGRLARAKLPRLVDAVGSELGRVGMAAYWNPTSYSQRLNQICADNWLAEKLMRIIAPTAVVCVDGYNSNSSFILAANRAGVPSVEYQHGIISKGHLGYTTGGQFQPPIEAVPRHFVCWGEFWRKAMETHSTLQSQLHVGTYEYGEWRLRRRQVRTNANGVLFIMQPSVETFLLAEIREFRQRYPNKRVGVKYHPKQVAATSFINGITSHFSEDIYCLFEEYAVVVGCFSTALFEAASMGCQVYAIPVVGFDLYQDAIREAGIKALAEFDQCCGTECTVGDDGLLIGRNSNAMVVLRLS